METIILEVSKTKPIDIEEVNRFLSITHGNGNGNGSGSGSGSGSGNGNGSGDRYGNRYGNGDRYGNRYGSEDGSEDGNGSGDGSGDGSGNGSEYGSGYGYGSEYGSSLLHYCNHKVLMIDKVATILFSIKNNCASGYIVNRDLTLTKTYVAKVGDYFAHGETLTKAFDDAQSKFNATLSDDEKINLFFKSSI